jgi:site-specific recombinase XerD
MKENQPTVFVTKAGIPWTRWGLASAFQRACRRADLRAIGPHVLQHTCRSRLIMVGMDLRTVQDLLGHKDNQDNPALYPSVF